MMRENKKRVYEGKGREGCVEGRDMERRDCGRYKGRKGNTLRGSLKSNGPQGGRINSFES